MHREFPIDPDLEQGYNVRLLRDDFQQLFESWTARSSVFRANADAQLDCAYDDGPRDKLDLFRCGELSAPLLVFIHGGYWQRGDKSVFSFIAEPFVVRGVDVADPRRRRDVAARVRGRDGRLVAPPPGQTSGQFWSAETDTWPVTSTSRELMAAIPSMKTGPRVAFDVGFAATTSRARSFGPTQHSS